MKLILKFNLVYIAVFLIGLVIAGYVADRLLQKNAREEMIHNAELIMEAALSTRAYTSNQIRPLLITQMKYSFMSQSVPAYSATEVLNGIRKKFPEYTYKEATLNPTNPSNRVLEWEADIVNEFRNNSKYDVITGERESALGPLLYIAKPIQVLDPACLACHSTVDAAPKTMIDRYGSANGFGWKLNEIIGAQIVSVPMKASIQRAQTAFYSFMLLLITIFVFLGIILNVMLRLIIITPISKLAKVADQISQGDLEVQDFQVRSKDEIRVLADSLNRMKKNLIQAMEVKEK